jgi:hypothetical protein
MSAHKAPFNLYSDFITMKDPGNAGTIVPDRNPSYVPLVSAASETRTLGRPTKRGIFLTLAMETDGGDIVLTVTGGINEDGDTTFTFSDAGQHLSLVSIKNGSNFQWVKVSDYGLANIAPADSDVVDLFSTIVASAAELNRAADMSTRVVDCTASTLAVTEALHDGKIITLNRAAGIAVTLPVPVAGMWFRFIVGTTFTGAASIKSTAGTQIMIGQAIMGNDSDNTVVKFPALAASTYDTIDLLGTGNSTGGIAGQTIEIRGLSATLWHVTIIGDAAGTEATPFADTVA